MDMTRRGFIEGTAATLGAASLAAVPVAFADENWDRQVDLVVVGGGTGLGAAVAGVQAGLSVLLLEKRGATGGAMKYSGGAVWLANNEYSQANGDNAEKAKTYIDKMLAGHSDMEDIEDAYINNTQKVVEMFHAAGIDLASAGPNQEYHPEWEGSIPEGGRSCQVLNNGEKDFSEDGGMRIATALEEACEAAGVEILLKTPAKRLVVGSYDENGVPSIAGVVAEDADGAELRIKANKGVILATGGFEWNQEYVKTFLRVPMRHGCAISWAENTGDGLTMAMAAGAKLNLMSQSFGQPNFTAHADYAAEHGGMVSMAGNAARYNPGSIIVDCNGKRFCREDASDYVGMNNTFGGYYNFGDNGYTADPAWWVCDQASYDANGGPNGTCIGWGFPVPDMDESEYVYTADTLEELAELIGIDAERFVATVEEYNKYAAEGRDPLFHRAEVESGGGKEMGLKTLETPPYYAVAMSAGVVGTMGGPRINKNAQVIHASGVPIPGLYAMGNCAGVGGPGATYGGSGGTLGPAFTFGVIAANHAAGL